MRDICCCRPLVNPELAFDGTPPASPQTSDEEISQRDADDGELKDRMEWSKRQAGFPSVLATAAALAAERVVELEAELDRAQRSGDDEALMVALSAINAATVAQAAADAAVAQALGDLVEPAAEDGTEVKIHDEEAKAQQKGQLQEQAPQDEPGTEGSSAPSVFRLPASSLSCSQPPPPLPDQDREGMAKTAALERKEDVTARIGVGCR